MKYRVLFVFLFVFLIQLVAQHNNYWNHNSHLVPWRFPLANPNSIERVDLTGDGKPDAIFGYLLPDSVPYIWVDEGGTMTWNCVEGSTLNGLLLVDRNKDGYFDGPRDLIVRWGDESGNGIPDIMMVIENGGSRMHHFFDWGADYMIIIDEDQEGVLNYIDWNKLGIQAWEHDGHSNFYTDYHGNITFLKMHGSSYRMNDMRFNWENPFIFYSEDNDPYSEWTIRLVDEPHFRKKEGDDPLFADLDKEIDIRFSQRITDVRMSWDMDNDNGPGNEFDFDMSIKLVGTGFDYSDQVHSFPSLKSKIDLGDRVNWVDPRWRELDELIFPDRQNAWDMVWNKGEWKEAHFVFDEDDDCNRWERVEFYDPLDLFKSGIENGGLDHNKQADVAGDRANWDMDFSGEGNLYIGRFDGKIHLYGAEWGAWRIDQTAFYYQGFGGNYGRWGRERLQKHADTFASIKYSDTNDSGFFDLIEYDLDGDGVFEDRVSLIELGIDDVSDVIVTSDMVYADFNKLFLTVADQSFERGMKAVEIAEHFGLDTHWYNFYKRPNSTFQSYQYGFWLGFYIYQDLRQMALFNGDSDLKTKVEKAYFSGDWELLLR